MVKFMVTNGGPHPADKWADITTDAIVDLIQVEQDSVTPEAAEARQAKRDLRPVLFAIFNEHHDRVQKHEQGNLAKIKSAEKAADHLAALPTAINDIVQHVPSTMEKVNAALAATPYARHFQKSEVQAVLHTIVSQHTADVMNIERSWHRDRLVAAKGA